MSDCVGTECYQVWYRISDEKAEVWESHTTNPDGSPQRWPMPGETDQLFNLLKFPQMREAWDRAAQEAIANFSVENKECVGCVCQYSDVVIETESRVPVNVPFDAGPGATWMIYGSYKLEMRRVLGTCHPIPQEFTLLHALDDAFYILMGSKKKTRHQKKT